MVSLRTKEFGAAAPFVIGSSVLIGLSTTVEGGADAFMIRLGFWIIAFGALVCLVVWALHRGGVLERKHAAAEARANAAEARAEALEARVKKLEVAAHCRELLQLLLTGDGDIEKLWQELEERN